jgi:hypothetical protein
VRDCAQMIRFWRACTSGGHGFQEEPFFNLFRVELTG